MCELLLRGLQGDAEVTKCGGAEVLPAWSVLKAEHRLPFGFWGCLSWGDLQSFRPDPFPRTPPAPGAPGGASSAWDVVTPAGPRALPTETNPECSGQENLGITGLPLPRAGTGYPGIPCAASGFAPCQGGGTGGCGEGGVSFHVFV